MASSTIDMYLRSLKGCSLGLPCLSVTYTQIQEFIDMTYSDVGDDASHG